MSILAHLLHVCVTLSSPFLTTLIHYATFITQNWGSGYLYFWTVTNERAQFQPQKNF